MILQRFLKEAFLRAVKTFPVVILTGPRQAGKSTLCKTTLSKTHRYVSLEDPDTRRQALEDPRTFLKNFLAPVILDEIQYAPELPSYIQTLVDADRKKYGQYILTGSQNFLMMEKVSQSLVGRAALLTLYPCMVTEADGRKIPPRHEPKDVADWILRGGYPELRARPELDRSLWCSSYIQLYLERDIRQILNATDLVAFERFLHLAALRTGQILNMSDLARDAGVSVPTASRWLSALQASYQIHLLPPFHANLSKRLIKAPKLYFGDTALASYLMGVHIPEVLLQGPFLGPLFETAVVLEHIKYASLSGTPSALSYFRTRDGLEVDLLIEQGATIHAREIKTQRTLSSHLGDSLVKTEALLKKTLNKKVLAPVEKKRLLSMEIPIVPWQQVEW